ncbi:MAG: MFS transporter [Anaerolineae bacterium]|nr:MFS transporter [Anaerolineae bacterium]
MARYLHLLRSNPDFAYLWFASVVSLLGDWFNIIALSALVSEYTNNSGLAVSGLLLARFLPPLIVSPYAGVLIDRFNRKRLLIYSDLLRAIIVLFLLFANSPDRLWLIYLMTVLQFAMSAIFEPARGAILPSLVSSKDLLPANTLSNVTWSVMLAIGAIIGGVTATLFGTATALVIDAATFALSAVLVSRIKPRSIAQSQTPTTENQPQNRGFRDGLRYVAANPGVAAALFIKFGLSLGSVDALMIAYATSLFVIGENGTGSLGILYSAFGFGAILGPMILNRFNDGSVHTMRRLVIASFACVTVGWLLFGFAPTLLLASLALIVRAMGGSATWTYSSTIIQMSVPDHFLGRVFALDWAGFYLAVAVSTLVTGLLIDTFGNQAAPHITIGSGILSIIPLLLWIGAVYWLERTKQTTLPAPSGD